MKTEPFDPVKHLDNPEVIRAYIEETQACIGALQTEIEAQARLNGMGAERELTLRAEVDRLRALDRAAAEYVESVICMRTHFTGDPPYVGWRGAGRT